MKAIPRAAMLLAAAVLISGQSTCQMDSRSQVLQTSKSAVELRSFQSRAFDTTDREKALRTVIATLQDLSFVVDKADSVLGTVTGTKFGKSGLTNYQLKMTVTVRPRNEKQLLVRASAQYNLMAVDDPEPYQDFFSAFSKAIFLTAHHVD